MYMNTTKLPKSKAAVIVAKNIKRLREKSGISQAKFAEQIKSSANNVYQIETGGRFPSGAMLDKIVKAFGIEYFELFIDYDKLTDEMAKEQILKELEFQAHSTLAKFLSESLNNK